MTSEPRRPTVVRHFGARVGERGGGGVASVMATHRLLPYEDVEVRFVTTCHLDARLWSAQHVPGALVQVAMARADRARSIVHVHLAGRGSIIREGAFARLARAGGVPTVLTVHASDLAESAVSHRGALRTVLRAAHVVHALGDASAAILRDVAGQDLDVRVVPNPVIPPDRTTDAGECPPVALFAGQQSRRKGLDVLAAAWPLVRRVVPDATLVIAGPAADVVLPPLEGVRLLGPIPREQVAAEIAAARVAVLPSRQENQPMFLLEAMAAARPVVATRIAELPNTVPDPDALITAGDVDELAQALCALLRDAAAATEAGRRNAAHVLRRQGPAPSAAAYGSLYRDARAAAGLR